MKKSMSCLGLDVDGETIAAAVAEPGGEVRDLGVVPNRPELVRRRDGSPPARLLRAALFAWAALASAAPLAAWVFLGREYPRFAAGALLALPVSLAAVLGARAAWREPRRVAGAPLAFAAANITAALVAYHAAAPLVSRVASDAELARLAGSLAPGVPIASYRIQPASLSFYAAAPVVRASRPQDLLDAASRGPLLIVTRPRDEAKLRSAGLPLHRWLDCERHCLYGTVPRPLVAGDGGPAAARGDAS